MPSSPDKTSPSVAKEHLRQAALDRLTRAQARKAATAAPIPLKTASATTFNGQPRRAANSARSPTDTLPSPSNYAHKAATVGTSSGTSSSSRSPPAASAPPHAETQWEEGKEERKQQGFEGGLHVITHPDNQYSMGCVSGCTIMALEASLQLLQGGSVSPALIGQILRAGAMYGDEDHCGIEDVLPHITRYSSQLHVVKQSMQVKVVHVAEVCKLMEATAHRTQQDVSALITKPPESIMIYYDTRHPCWWLFDSHKRPLHHGAAFIRFSHRAELCNYLQLDLFHMELDSMEPLQQTSIMEELYSYLEATLLQAVPSPPDRAARRVGHLSLDEERLLQKEIQAIMRRHRDKRQAQAQQKQLQQQHQQHRDAPVRDSRPSPQPSPATAAVSTAVPALASSRAPNAAAPSSWSLDPAQLASNGPALIPMLEAILLQLKKLSPHSAPPAVSPSSPLDGHPRVQPPAAAAPSPVVSPTMPMHETSVHSASVANTVLAAGLGDHREQKDALLPPQQSLREPRAARPPPVEPHFESDRQLAIRLAKEAEEEERSYELALQLVERDRPDPRNQRLALELMRREQEEQQDLLMAQEEARLERERLRVLEEDERYVAVVVQHPSFQTFWCPTCMEDKVMEDVMSIPCCVQRFCVVCYHEYVLQAIEDRELPIKCPLRCGQLLLEEDILLWLTPEETGRYSMTSLKLWAQSTPGAFECPKPDCQGMGMAEDDSTRCVCPMHGCGYEWCKPCGVPWAEHEGLTCEELKAKQAVSAEAELARANIGEQNMKPCPNCRVIVDKDQACNAVVCDNCKANLCWLCWRQFPGDAHAHYNHVDDQCYGKCFEGCPGH